MFTPNNERIQTVKEITQSIRAILETSFPFVSVVGEISNLRKPFSGHLYFTLKDSEAQLRAVLFKPQQRYLKCTPEDGMEVLCRGRISLYEARGEYQLIVDYLERTGEGGLQLAFDALKKRLAEEGLFAEERKKQLPMLPEKITIITSPQGAAIRDFLKVAARRFAAIPIEIMPVRVQGDGAAQEICEAIRLCNSMATSSVIVLCRGGGSLEDLWAFNEEVLARAIADSKIPVVSAVGHEVDYTIADFVADLRAATPTAAAEMIIPDRTLLAHKVKTLRTGLAKNLTDNIARLRQQVDSHRRVLRDPTAVLDNFRLATDHALSSLLHAVADTIHRGQLALADQRQVLAQHNPEQRLRHQQQWTNKLQKDLCTAMRHQLQRKWSSLTSGVTVLDAVSPLKILGRGYSIVQDRERRMVIKDASQVNKGDNLHITLHRGTLECQVTGGQSADEADCPKAER